MKTAFVLPCLLFLALAVPASAEKTPVSVECTVEPNDTIGMRVCTEVRDQIAASPRYREASGKEAHWALHIITTIDTKDASSAQAVVIVLTAENGLSFYMDSSVMVTGSSRVSEQAKSVIAALDQRVSLFNKNASSTEQ